MHLPLLRLHLSGYVDHHPQLQVAIASLCLSCIVLLKKQQTQTVLRLSCVVAGSLQHGGGAKQREGGPL